jgi:undecaprenyl diphosphate synthase
VPLGALARHRHAHFLRVLYRELESRRRGGRLSPEIQKRIGELEERSKHNRYTAVVALSYGGREDILQAARQLAADGKEIVEKSLASRLWTAGLPDPDLIIRTSGEQRLSNFLTWQSTYSELFFSKTLWPDFSEEEFRGIVEAYGKRERRTGT